MEELIKVKIIQIDKGYTLPLPKYMSEGAAGMDLFAAVDEPTAIYPGDIKLIPTGIKIALPIGFEAQIRPRSGLALKYGIGMVNSPGTIDSDYRGEIGVILINWGHKKFVVNKGERIAQMIVARHSTVVWEPVEELDSSTRNGGGFGHTGV